MSLTEVPFSFNENFDPLKQSPEFRYRLLDRLRSDCEYFFGNGHRNVKYLWGQDPHTHVSLMRKLYSSFDITERPEWIDLNLISEYENRFLD